MFLKFVYAIIIIIIFNYIVCLPFVLWTVNTPIFCFLSFPTSILLMLPLKKNTDDIQFSDHMQSAVDPRLPSRT